MPSVKTFTRALTHVLTPTLIFALSALAQTSPPAANGVVYATATSNLATLCSDFIGTVVISVAVKVTANTTIPSQCSIRMQQGGIVAVALSVRLTFDGAFEAGLYQVFTGAGVSGITFGSSSVDAIRPQWAGAAGNGTSDDSAAIQWALNVAANSTVKRIALAPAQYLLNSPMDVTSGSGINHSSIAVYSEGRRGTAILANTGGTVFDLTGSSYTSWRGLYIVSGPTNPSTVGFFAAASKTSGDSSYNKFDEITLQLYVSRFTSLYGSVGYIFVGSEENTIETTNTYATTPYIFTTTYADVSASYPSPFQSSNVAVNHSEGMTTFSGENSSVTFDRKGANLVLDGANSTELGNMYFGNMNIGAAGANNDVIRVLNGTLESFHGRCKVEGKPTLLDITAGQIYGWDLEVSYGAVDAKGPVVAFNTVTLSNTRFVNVELTVNYFDPAQAEFAGKPLFSAYGVPSSMAPTVANVLVKVNQTLAQFGQTSPWPLWFSGHDANMTVELVDKVYTLSAPSTVSERALQRQSPLPGTRGGKRPGAASAACSPLLALPTT